MVKKNNSRKTSIISNPESKRFLDTHYTAVQKLNIDPEKSLLSLITENENVERYNQLVIKSRKKSLTPEESAYCFLVRNVNERAHVMFGWTNFFREALLSYYRNGDYNGDYSLDHGLSSSKHINDHLENEIRTRISHNKSKRNGQRVKVIDVCGGIGSCIASIKERYGDDVYTYLFDVLDVSQPRIALPGESRAQGKTLINRCAKVADMASRIDVVYYGNVESIHSLTQENKFDVVISTTSLGGYTFSGVEDIKKMHDILKVGGTALVEVAIRTDDIFFKAHRPKEKDLGNYLISLGNQCRIAALDVAFGQYFLEIKRTSEKPIDMRGI